FPQLRLGYRLDTSRDRWLRVPDNQLAQHLADMVCDSSHNTQSNQVEDKLDALISDTLLVNITPITLPIQFTLSGKHVIVKAIHAFGDGRFIMHLIAFVMLAALQKSAFDALQALPMNTWIPLGVSSGRRPGRESAFY